MTVIRSTAARFSGRNFDLILTVRRFDDSANNRTRVNLTLDIRSNIGTQTYQFGSGTLSINTSAGNFSQNWDADFRGNPAGTVKRLAERDVIVNHNSSGAASITTSASASANVFGSASIGSATSGLTTYARAPNPPPSVTAATPVERSIAVSWQAASGGAGVSNYDIDRIENNTTWERILSTTSLSLTSSNLNPRSTYRFRVRANGPGGSSGFRESNSQTIAPAASTPTTTAERNRRSVTVSLTEPSVIDNTTNITSYTTQRRQDNGAWGDERTTTDLINRAITYTDLPSETNQQFRGRADTNRGSSDFSESQVIFVPGLPDPPSEIIPLKLGANVQVILVAGADGGAPVLTYTLEKRVSEDDGFTWSDWTDEIIVPFSESVYLYENLDLERTYQFRALATNEEGNSEGYTESPTVYLPAIVRIYDSDQANFRMPNDFKRYDENIGDWVGLSTSKRYFNGEWFDLD